MMFSYPLRSHTLIHQRRKPSAFRDHEMPLRYLLNRECLRMPLPLFTRRLIIYCSPHLILHSPAFQYRAMRHAHDLLVILVIHLWKRYLAIQYTRPRLDSHLHSRPLEGSIWNSTVCPKKFATVSGTCQGTGVGKAIHTTIVSLDTV